MADTPADRRARRLFQNALRHRLRIEATLSEQWRRKPRPHLRALLVLGAAEALLSPESAEKIVHGTVEMVKLRCSAGEARFANALLRAILPALAAPDPGPGAAEELLARHFSHPRWMVSRWRERFGAAATHALLRWNQQPARQYVHLAGAHPPPAGCSPTQWEQFYEWSGNQWETVATLLAEGSAYVQDPFTRIPLEQLAPQPGERILDLCAAPGGKSVHLARALDGSGSLTCVDLPGERLGRLEQNLERLELRLRANIRVVAGDLEQRMGEVFGDRDPQERFDAVLLDVPCSNTGVIRRRPDIKDRLCEAEIRRVAVQQRKLLRHAAILVRPGGRLVYSTCSLEPEENEDQAAAFLDCPAGRDFHRTATAMSFPPEAKHDGGWSCRLDRAAVSPTQAASSPARESRV